MKTPISLIAAMLFLLMNVPHVLAVDTAPCWNIGQKVTPNLKNDTGIGTVATQTMRNIKLDCLKKRKERKGQHAHELFTAMEQIKQKKLAEAKKKEAEAAEEAEANGQQGN